jgi:hypothetical protein
MASDCSTDYIINGSFELPIVPMGVGIQNPAPADCNWTTSSGAYSELLDDIQLGGLGYPFPPDGYQVMYWTNGKITQNTGLTVAAGKAYKLSFKLLRNTIDNPAQYVYAAFEDAVGNTIASSDSFLAALPQLTWTSCTFTLNTAAHPESVGKALVVALHSGAYVYVDEAKLTIGPAGDLNGDCAVNFADFSLLAASWLHDNKIEQSQY